MKAENLTDVDRVHEKSVKIVVDRWKQTLKIINLIVMLFIKKKCKIVPI